jgi:hypothetical protein
MSKRSSSSKLFFYDLHGLGTKVQVMADARYIRFFPYVHHFKLVYAQFVAFHPGHGQQILHFGFLC